MTTTDLKRMLLDRRGEVQSEVQGRIHDVRATGPSDVLDRGEDSEADVQEDIEFALIQMKAEILSRIDEALVRLEGGEYGRALPFAVRCYLCEEGRERSQHRARQVDYRREPSLFFGMHVAAPNLREDPTCDALVR